MPKHCPVCGGEIVREEGEAASRCINTNCPARLKESVLHFAARGVMDIDGMGDVLVDQLVSRGLVKSVADIYELTLEQLLELDRMGQKSAEKILRNIDASRQAAAAARSERPRHSLRRRAHRADSRRNVRKPGRHLPTPMKRRCSRPKKWARKSRESIRQFFHERRNRELVERLRKAGLTFEHAISKKTGGALEGKTFVLTGTLPNSVARGRQSTHRSGGRQSDRIGEQEDRLRASPAKTRAPSSTRRNSWGSP